MSATGRLPVAIVSLVVLAAACSDDGGGATTTVSPSSTTTTVATTTTAGGGGETTTTGDSTTTTGVTTTTEAGPDVITLAVDLSDGVVTGGGRRSVPEGTIVQLVVTADVEDLVHVHGYDLEAAVSPNSAAVFDFAADSTGIFIVELEDSGVELLQLEIVP